MKGSGSIVRSALRSLAIAMCCGLLAASAATAGNAPRPQTNFVFILCDDLGYADLGCFGSKEIKTPHLDRLAADGMRLTACYSGSPVCSPSRAALMTGRNPNRLGIRDWIPPNTGIFLKEEEVTVAELLKSAGYRTAHVGKWHLNSRFNGMEPTPGTHGFDHWFSTQNNATPTHQNPGNFVRNGRRVGPLQGNSSTLIVDEALGFLDGVEDAPFALFVWFHAPHEIVATPDDFRSEHYPDLDRDKAEYYASVTLVDREVGRLLKKVDDLGLRERTFVEFTSDNGPETLNRYPTANHSHGSPGPYRGMKLHVTEAGYRVPGIVRWPGHTKPGSVSDEAVAGYDLLPTLCEIAGIKPPTDRVLDGTSVARVLEGKRFERTKPLYWQYDKALSKPWTVALRQGKWKLLGDAKLEQFALYDLKADPGEKTDLASAQPRRVRELAESMRKLHGEINPVADPG
jgi:arylsulfatase A